MEYIMKKMFHVDSSCYVHMLECYVRGANVHSDYYLESSLKESRFDQTKVFIMAYLVYNLYCSLSI